MPRRLLGIFMLLLVSVSVMQAQGDAALLTVGAEPVGRNEFEYHFRKSLEKRADVFAQTYARFKQKVQGAKDLGLDTMESYLQEKETYRRILSRRMADGKNPSGRSSSKKEWIRVAHVTFPLHQQAGRKRQEEAKHCLDSLYGVLKKGGDVALEWLPWTQTRFMLNEWQTQLDRLDKGEYSSPFYSPLGMHIIVWTDKRVMSNDREKPSEHDEALALKEMEETLLVLSLERYWEQTISCTEKELENHFKKNKEQYGWGVPHYQGAVIHCQNKKEAKRIKKYLKKYPQSLWAEAYKRMPEDLSEGCKMEVGLFAIGRNPYIDKLAFKCGEFEALPEYPYTWLLGKKLKKGPGVYADVLEKVSADCLKIKKKAEMEAMMQKYEVEIDAEVLKTVNHDGNK